MEKEKIAQLAREGIIEVVFEKTNGTMRIMQCTLQPEFLPNKPEIDHMDSHPAFKPKREENPGVLSVWDIQEQGWRSFRIASVKSVTSLEGAV